MTSYQPAQVLATASLSVLVALQPACGSDASDDPDGEGIPACKMDLEPELARLEVPGLSAAIVKNGRVECTAVAGFANIEEGVPVSPSTVFWWASVSKPVAATAALSVWEEEKFELEADVNTYLPFEVKHPDPDCDGPITFLQLLTHTSSIFEDEGDPPYKNAFVVGEPRQPLGDYLKDYLLPDGGLYSTDHYLAACPGKRYNYSSIGYGLLGFAIESLAGQPFDQLCKERVFAPLGMSNTSFTLADLDESRLAMPYGRSSAPFKPLGHREHANYPDGSLRSSPLELSRFLIMSMQFGQYEETPILSEDTAREMFRLHVPTLDDTQGLGWYYDDYGSRDVIGHDGEDPGATSFVFFDPADGAAVLLVANGVWDWDAAEDLLVELFDESSSY